MTGVEQAWICSNDENTAASEAVIVYFDIGAISPEALISIHLHTHSCTSGHRMRGKYRSAIYIYNDARAQTARQALEDLQKYFDGAIITKVLPLQKFKLNEENYLGYYYKDPTKPFCQNIVSPKLKILLAEFAGYIAPEHA